jgi:hypothetical protein
MSTKTGRSVALMLILVGLASTLIAAPARGNPPQQGTATEQAAPTGEALSVDELGVLSVDTQEL